MSRENVELVYRAHDAFNRRDLDALLALHDPEVEFVAYIMALEGGGSYRGHDGVRSWWESILGGFPDYSAEIEEVRDLGEVTVARMRSRGHGLESNTPMEQTSWQVVEWRHRKAIWWRHVRSEAEALKAAGLRE